MATTINFAVPLLDSDNNPALGPDGQPVLLGKLLSNEIMGSSINDDPMKYFIWALDIRKEGSITLEDADKAKLVEIVTASNNLTVLGKGRLIETINGTTDDSLTAAPVSVDPQPEVAPAPDWVPADPAPVDPNQPVVEDPSVVQQVSDLPNQVN